MELPPLALKKKKAQKSKQKKFKKRKNCFHKSKDTSLALECKMKQGKV